MHPLFCKEKVPKPMNTTGFVQMIDDKPDKFEEFGHRGINLYLLKVISKKKITPKHAPNALIPYYPNGWCEHKHIFMLFEDCKKKITSFQKFR